MKLPRNVTCAKLAGALQRLGYRLLRQRGNHVHLITNRHGEHHVVVPDHRPLKPGMLNHLLKDVADHHGMTRDEIVNRLEL